MISLVTAFIIAFTPMQPECVKGAGCSGNLCISSADMKKELISTCEWKDEYSCYTDAICEMQGHGHCGWTYTPALQRCIEEKRNNYTPVVR